MGIEVTYYSVIYDLIEDSKRLLSGLLEPIFQKNIRPGRSKRSI
ncbi:MAG: hypothetical protein CM15mP12_1310 [Gammaproteobacteria bacterium]|nr:MAG: hypothetical protein CM15mP12_1310 [Gammaproteobacteria bacterium]